MLSNLVFAHEKRDLLQKKASLTQLDAILVKDNSWIPYPEYADRAGWDKLSGEYKAILIEKGEKYLDYKWRTVVATDYLDFERTGARTTMEEPFGSNSNALTALVMAELAEGKGRFTDQIINGVWLFSEITSWALSAHLAGPQKSKRSLPDYTENVIDLAAGDIGSLLAWTHYFFKEPFDKVNPIIASRLKTTLQKRILDAYIERSDFWWQAFNLKPDALINNWNPWCNFNVLTCFMLIEDNPEKRVAGVYRTMKSVDEFINYNNNDGACEEGPSYWGHAAGKLYDYLQILDYATKARLSIFDQAIIKNMGEYIAKSYVGDGWVVNFADAKAKGGGNYGLIYRYGKAVNSPMMKQFGAYLKDSELTNLGGRDLFRNLEDMKYQPEISDIKPSLPNYATAWYPQTEFCFMREGDLFFAAKGGYNAESHNHNDVGTFSLYFQNTPVFIDAGVGTYTRQTFSNERYSIWTMQSDYHNLPMINGKSQKFGKEFRSKSVAFIPEKKVLSMDIAGAYPEDVAVLAWKRDYELTASGELKITDSFVLKEIQAANQINFLVWQKPDISVSGKAVMNVNGKNVILCFNPKQFESKVEVIEQTDTRLSSVWGKEIYRITLTDLKPKKKGKYEFIIKEEK